MCDCQAYWSSARHRPTSSACFLHGKWFHTVKSKRKTQGTLTCWLLELTTLSTRIPLIINRARMFQLYLLLYNLPCHVGMGQDSNITLCPILLTTVRVIELCKTSSQQISLCSEYIWPEGKYLLITLQLSGSKEE